MADFLPVLSHAKLKRPVLWPPALNLSRLNPIPQKYRPSRKLRMRQKSKSGLLVSDGITRLRTSFNVLDSIRELRRRRWRLLDGQHVVVFAFIAFSLYILPSAPFIKTAVLAAIALLILMPITQQFFLPSLPIWTYLLYFFSSRFIATEYRPHIWVKVLPALENVLYGANLSNILSAHNHPVLDLLAWVPYGLGHFSLPAVCSALLFVFAAPGTTPVFARSFGYMCMIGVTIQLLLPCTPPWYEKDYGLVPAHYGMQGSPAGLARIDKLFGLDIYTTSFTTAPVPFGAFPSLHAGNAVLEALFIQHCFPRLRGIVFVYVAWISWATMYLNHHYAIDLVGGGLLAAGTYYVARARSLPRPQLDKSTRWEYEFVEYGDRPRLSDEEFGHTSVLLGQPDWRSSEDSDEWTLGSSSSYDSASGTSSSPGCLSPSTPDDESHPYLPHGDFWKDDNLDEQEMGEVVVLR